MKKLLILILLINISLSAETVKIGVVLHLTGDLAMHSAAFREGMEIAAEQQNQQSDDLKVELIIEDGHASPKYSNTAARKLVYQDRVNAAVISSYFDVMTSGSIYEKGRVPTIVLWDSNPEIESFGEYIFAIGPWTPASGEVSASFAFNKLKARSAYVINLHESWSESVAKAFKKSFVKLGGRVLAVSELEMTETDFKPIAMKIKSAKPDVVYSPLGVGIVPFYKKLKEAGVAAEIISSDVISDEHIQQMPSAFEGIYQSNLKEPVGNKFKNLKEAYLKKFDREITFGWYVASGYDAVNLIIEAAKGNLSLQESLYATNDYQGASSVISFNKQGSSPQYPVMYQVKSKEFIRVK